MEFKYKIKEKENYNILAISGNLIEQNQSLKLLEDIENLILKNSTKIIIDMTDSKYMNSTGLNVLINILTKTRKSGGETIICCVPDKIKQLLVITKLSNVFTIAETVDAAVKQIK
jgi:anti-sigma B factor antagonist